MNLEKAISILETHNKWRRGNINEMDYTIKELGIAIDLILAEVKQNKHDNIPITEDWFKKFNQPDIHNIEFKTIKIDLRKNEDEYDIFISDSEGDLILWPRSIKYVHEWQNFWKELTGE